MIIILKKANTMKNILIIGYGSIGQRHAKILKDLKYNVYIVSKRVFFEKHFFKSIEEALKKHTIDYVIIANETYLHKKTLELLKLYGYSNDILIEKPLFLPQQCQRVCLYNQNVYVGYNLRFHPIIEKVKKIIEKEKILSVNGYVGQYLPTWRPNTNYKNSYSASMEKGGGVLNDLSHELDYLTYLFGDWTKLVAAGGQISDLNINSYDSISILFSTKRVFNITLELNYLDKIIQRYFIINTNSKTIKADLINNTLLINDELEEFNVSRNLTYTNQHLAVLERKKDQLCTFEEGLKCLHMIRSIEKSLQERKWIMNE